MEFSLQDLWMAERRGGEADAETELTGAVAESQHTFGVVFHLCGSTFGSRCDFAVVIVPLAW